MKESGEVHSSAGVSRRFSDDQGRLTFHALASLTLCVFCFIAPAACADLVRR